MKTNLRFFLLFLIFIANGSLVSAQQRGMKPVELTVDGKSMVLYQQSHALLIGVSSYTNGWNTLPGVNRDIPRVKAALEKNGFQVDVVMNPANKDALDRAFSDFIFDYGNSRDNRLLFYYAGHGYTIKTDWGGELGYIIPANTPLPSKNNPSAFQSKAMEMAQIDIYAKRIQSKHAIFLFDACFAGTIFTEDRSGIPEYISYSTTKPVRQFITSGSANETVADESSFCDQFIKALDGKADYDRDGYLTGSELGSFLKKEVSTYSNNRQHPQSGKINDSRLDEGDFVFVINTAASPGIVSTPTQPPKGKVIIEETQIIGAIELSTELSGSLYLDGDFARSVNANSRYTLKDLSVGEHTLKITGDETWEGLVTVEPNGLAKVDVRKKVSEQMTDMVLVKGGTFQRGSNNSDDEKPVHSVTVNDLYMGKYEVTQKQWRDVTGNDPSNFKKCDNCPVEQVYWDDIQEFIQKLNQKTGKYYRLPTEAEWEYAAKGGNKSKGYTYSGSNNLDDVAWYSDNSDSKTHPVGQKQPNELGLFDMSGNVWEWCSDWYGSDYYQSSPSSNPKGASTGSYRVFRGGGWGSNARYCRAARRNDSYPDRRYSDLGFRLASPK